MAPRFTDDPDARSKSITHADGIDTYGILNRHPAQNVNLAYQVGVSEDKGARRSMEDAHSFVVDFDNVRGQGFFAVFDGHAGKHAAEWCGAHFHEYLLNELRECPTLAVPDILNQTFHNVDASLSQMCEESAGKIHSGCTAVTAFLRIEDPRGSQAFRSPHPRSSTFSPSTSPIPNSATSSSTTMSDSPLSSAIDHPTNNDEHSPQPDSSEAENDLQDPTKGKKDKKSGSRLKQALKSLGGGASNLAGSISPRSGSPSGTRHQKTGSVVSGPHSAHSRQASAISAGLPSANMATPPSTARRVLYTANVGDARGVLCRGGRAARLTYDHKGSDKQEAKRITDAGGFVMSGRVNGVLAVTRSLGDSSMKEFVVGAPYTTETELCEEDEFLVLACDGLWDVTTDQQAIDLVREIDDAQHASQKLLKYALSQHTTDNVTVVVVRFKSIVPKTA